MKRSKVMKSEKHLGDRSGVKFRFDYMFLCVIILLALFLRMYNTGDLSPGSDSFDSYVALEIANGNLNPFYIDVSTLEIGNNEVLINPMKYFFYWLSVLILGNTLFAIKLVTSIFTIICIFALYLIVEKYYGRLIGLFSAFLFAVLPYSINMGRSLNVSYLLIGLLALSLYYFMKGLEKKYSKYYYISFGLFFLSQIVSEFQLLFISPFVILLLFVFLRKNNRNFDEALYHIYHIILAFFSYLLVYIIYLMIPLFLWNDSRYIIKFTNGLFHGLQGEFLYHYSNYFSTLFDLIRELFFSSLMVAVFVPMIAGCIIAIIKYKENINIFLIGLLCFFLIYPFLGDSYNGILFMTLFSIVIIASIGLIYTYSYYTSKDMEKFSKYENRKIQTKYEKFKILMKNFSFPAVSFAWAISILFFLRFYSVIFAQRWEVFYEMLVESGFFLIYDFLIKYFNIIVGVFVGLFVTFHLFSAGIVRYKLRKSFAQKSVFVFVLISFLISMFFVGLGFSVDHKNEGVRLVSKFIEDNSESYNYACVAGEYNYVFSYYINKPCLSWMDINIHELKRLVENGELKYFILNKYSRTPGFGRGDQSIAIDGFRNEFLFNCKKSEAECLSDYEYVKDHEDKYEWFRLNTKFVNQESLNLPKDNPYFNVYEVKK